MEYELVPDHGRRVREKLAELTGDNVDIIEGYLFVSIRIDGGMVIGHNSCCLAHVMNGVLEYMKENPGVNMTNPDLRQAHGE